MSLTTRKNNNNQRARNLKLNYNLHEDDIKFALNYFDYKCAYCQKDLTQENFEIDHLIPLSEENDDIINFGSVNYNIVPSCRKCNENKGTKDWQWWIKKKFLNSDEIIYKIIEYQNLCGMDEIIW